MQSRRVLSAKVSIIDSLSDGKLAGNFMMTFDDAGKCCSIETETFICLFSAMEWIWMGHSSYKRWRKKSAFAFSRRIFFLIL